MSIIMSRKREKSRGPTTEETVNRLETRLREFEDRTAKKIRDLEDLVQYLTEKLTNIHGSSKEEKEGTQGKLVRLEETVAGFDERMTINKRLLEQIREKLYDFDINKKNNLIFNGVPKIQNENNDRLVASIKTIIRTKLKIIRFIDILVKLKRLLTYLFHRVLSQNVDRVDTGPSVLKCRPVTVTFRHFKDREDILKASRFLKITEDYVYITEDVSKSIRESQQELRKFLSMVRKTNPGVKASLRYDRLIIDGEIFFYNTEKKSVELISDSLEEKKEKYGQIHNINCLNSFNV